MSARQRIPEWESQRALAVYLFDHSPVTAQFQGEMSAKIARILDKTAEKTVHWSVNQASRILAALREKGYAEVDGTQQKPTAVRWVGPNPETIEWKPPRPPSTGPLSRIERLEAEVAVLTHRLELVPQQIREAVDIALEAWTR